MPWFTPTTVTTEEGGGPGWKGAQSSVTPTFTAELRLGLLSREIRTIIRLGDHARAEPRHNRLATASMTWTTSYVAAFRSVRHPRTLMILATHPRLSQQTRSETGCRTGMEDG